MQTFTVTLKKADRSSIENSVAQHRMSYGRHVTRVSAKSETQPGTETCQIPLMPERFTAFVDGFAAEILQLCSHI